MTVLTYTLFWSTSKCNNISSKVFCHALVINFLNFQFMNFWNIVTFRGEMRDVVFFIWQLLHCSDLSHLYTLTQMHTDTHTHTHTHTHTNLNFVTFWKDREIKYTSNWDNAGPGNLRHRNSCFLMKTLNLTKLLGKLREIN